MKAASLRHEHLKLDQENWIGPAEFRAKPETEALDRALSIVVNEAENR